MFSRLLIAIVLIATGAAALVVIGFVALDGRAGGAPFATTAQSSVSTGEPTHEAEVDVEPEPVSTPATSAPSIATDAPVPPSVVPPRPNTTTSAAAVAPGLHDLPPFGQPAGYEIQDRWSDGPSRLTLWQPGEDSIADLDIFDTIEFGTGAWRASRSGEVDGVTWATLTAVGHPWCIWLEIYAIRSEIAANNVANRAPTFLVVEGPFCDSEPGSFA